MVRIVTDSGAFFADPGLPRQLGIEVLPLRLQVGGQMVAEADLTTEQLLERSGQGPGLPRLEAPSPEQFTAVFEALAQTTGEIVAIHFSGKLCPVPQQARAGADHLRGRCQIHVIDSLTASAGLGGLVERAARAARQGASADEVVKAVRGQIPRQYGMFFTQRMHYLGSVRRVGRAHAILGDLLGIHPCLALEDGELVPMEKVRTRAGGIEKLAEFAAEFAHIESGAIVQPTSAVTPETRSLLEQLESEFPGRRWPLVAYGPSLASLLGPEALGVLIQEGVDPEG